MIKFEADGAVHDVHKQRSRRPCTATSPASPAMVLEQYTWSPLKSAKQCAHETGISRPCVQHILKVLKADVRSYLNETLQGQWTGWRGSVEYPPHSPDLTPPPNFVGSLNDVVYRRKSLTMEMLWEDIQTSCAAIPVDTLTTDAQALVC
jgi:hypothetical protein